MDIGTLYEFVNFCLNKYQAGSYSPQEFNTVLAATYLDLLKVKLGLPEDYQLPSKQGINAVARQSYQNSQMLTDDMEWFITTTPTPIVKVGRFFPYPADYIEYSSAFHHFVVTSDIPGGEPYVCERYIENVTDSEFKFRKQNAIIYPTQEYPILAFENNGMVVEPASINKVFLTYVRMPAQPVFGYTIDPATNDVIYNPLTSTQLEFRPIMHNDYAMMIMKYIGINIRDADITTFAQTRQREGS